ncbi:MAG: flagellar motor protein MotB [Defluviitaleaceae bacterium]|nr:flagellar motor protein MotB [Defluviitaleaceae bacterium]
MAKRKKKEEGGGGSLWLLSYSDLMTVLFALFVMLYALSEVDEELWERLVIAASFGNNLPAPMDFAGQGINNLMGNGIVALPDFNTVSFERPIAGGEGGQEQNRMEVVADVLRTYFAYELMVGELVDVAIGEDGRITISMHGDMYFAPGQAIVRPEIMPIIEAVASGIGELRDTVIVSVEGHTDSDPINTLLFPDNRALGSARARAVANLLIYEFQVVDPAMVTVVSHGEHHPVADNNTAEGRAANRRVEIILTQVD